MTRHRVLIVEDHGLVRAGLRALLEGSSAVEVVGEAADGNEGLDAMAELRPDIVLMDISMPGLNGIEAIRRAAKLRPRPRVLALSMHDEREYVRNALAAGAAGYLLKTANRDELEHALAAVARGEIWVSPAVANHRLDDATATPASEPVEALTTRQREVLQLLAEGHPTREIARRLRISVKTVESHRAHIMERLGIRTLAGLVRYAVRTGIVQEA